MNTSYQRFRRFAAVLVGIVFLVSGLLKMIDPVGTMLILQEYFRYFQVPGLMPAAKGLGIALSVAEAAVGVSLITGVLRKMAAVLTYVLLGFFTIVTFVLWVLNPSMDCGCFGEAVHLTHAQSFWKNVILLLLSVIAFTPFHDFGRPKRNRIVAAVLAGLSLLFVVIYSNRHLPIMDFTAFDWGAELYASLDDEVAADNHYKAAYVYQKEGKEGVFDLTALPDSTWTFVRVDTVFRKTTAVSEDYPILSFSDADGVYHDRMAAEGHVVVLSVYDVAKAPWERVREHYHAVLNAGGMPLVLVSAVPGDVRLPQDLPLYYADYKTLITLNRSNGGGSYFNEGELVNKWDVRHLPENLQADFAADPVDLSTHYIIRRRLRTQGFCVYLAALLLLI